MYTLFEFQLCAAFSFLLLFLDVSFGSILQIFRKTRVSKTVDDDCNLTSKIVIVTGANTGIGKATSIELALRGATVVLACRDVQRGMEASNDINNILKKSSKEYPYACNGKAQFMRLDLSELTTVIDFAERIHEQFSSVDVLVNNAGLNGDGLLSNGMQRVWQVNYLGHYLLTRALMSKLKRVVNLSSVTHHFGQADFCLSSTSSAGNCYADSKLYMNLLTMEINKGINLNNGMMQEGHKSFPLLAVSANPGAVRSDIWRNFPFQKLFHAFMKVAFLEVEEGAATSIYGATASNEEVLKVMLDSAEKGLTLAERGGRMVRHPLVPYLVPYSMPVNWLPLEMAGRFCGPRFSVSSLPSVPCTISSTPEPIDSMSQLSKALWDFSGVLCKDLLSKANVKPSSFEFLN